MIEIDIIQIQKILPHRYPMLLIDRVLELNINQNITAYKNVTINESVFNGHFPSFPIYPGVMIIEGMAQAGAVMAFVSINDGKLVENSDKIVYFMGIDKARFRQPVKPGDRLVYKLEFVKKKGAVWVLSGKAYVDEKLCAEAELMAMIADRDK